MASKQQEKNSQKNEQSTRQRKGKKSKKEVPKMEEEKVKKSQKEKKIEDNEDDIMLEELCAKMVKNGRLKYTKDRKGNLVLIKQNDGLTMQDYKVFGFVALLTIYVLFFYDNTHKITVNYYYECFRAYIKRFSDRILHQIDLFVSGPEF
ncbi:unnamed protein product [Oikopleura dioica]|uniref:Uncharacterized protein n=1 Tax=Oikopleura dioica TaxID=34765 RepID=E4X4J5_OIKDI|nr:unnamed protein product [Oikopleura dioica]